MVVAELFNLMCQHVNKEALAVAKANPPAGLFYNKGMTASWEQVDRQIEIHKDLIKALMPYNLKNKRLSLQEALEKFDALQQGGLFELEDEEAVNSLRKQAAGIKLMIGRLNKKKHNMVNGARTKHVFKSLFSEAAHDSPKLCPFNSDDENGATDRTCVVYTFNTCDIYDWSETILFYVII